MANVNTTQNQQLRSAASATRLRVRLLGPMVITSDDKPVAISSKKARALLGYLALREGTEVARSALTGLLWGERSESQARASLRQALSELRTALGALAQHSIIATKEAITWVSGAAWVDAKALEGAAGSKDERTLRAAADLIGGELMEGLSISEPSFEQWLASERERFRLIGCGIYARVSEAAEQDGRLEEALNFGLRLLALDPLQENVHRTLMRLYAAQGRHDAALAQYERCRRELSDQLGVAPQPETEELARGIRARRRDGLPKPRFSPTPAGRPDQSNRPDRSDHPTIAVLPFTNLSADPGQRYFSDGVTEDIITELSRFRSLSVIAHNTAFRYRDPNVDLRGVAEELGAQFVVEGSVRKAGKQIRVTAQLVDAATGKHIWAERFDREEQAIFAVQDEVVSTIAATLVGRLQAAGAEHARRKPPTSLAAYECVLRGNALAFGDPEADAEACRLFKQAIALDPEYARAHALLALAEYRVWRLDPAVSDGALERAISAAKKAGRLDQNDSVCQSVNGWIHLILRAFDLAEQHYRKGRDLNPNSPSAVAGMGILYNYLGRPDEAIVYLDEAKLLDRFFDPAWYWHARGVTHFVARQYDEAIADFAHGPVVPQWALAYVAACYTHTDRIARAREVAAEIRLATPGFSIAQHLRIEPYKHQADVDHLATGLRKAGLPE